MTIKKFYKKYQFYLLPILLIFVLSFSRLIPHPSNFTPIIATGIFAGFYFKQFYLSLFIVIFSMFIGDLFLGFHSTMFFTYISLSAAVVVGFFIKDLKFNKILYSGLSSSIIFYIITNFGVWFSTALYEKSLTGLMQSYIMAIPFFHNTLISTLIYLAVFKLVFDLSIKKKIIKKYT